MTHAQRWWSGAMLALAWPVFGAVADDAATNTAPAIGTPPDASTLVDQAEHDVEKENIDAAIREVSAALELDPKNVRALDLRATIYVHEKLWDRAERDYTMLNDLGPSSVYQYKLGQIKFLQKDFSNARALFARLKDDPKLGDLSRYKVFICDLLGGHEAIAARDLATLDQTGKQPSFYFGQAAWQLYHDQRPVANRLFAQATGKFSTTICGLYFEALVDVQPFHTFTATFTTRDGKKFDQARVFLESDGLRTMTHAGWVTIALAQLPDDLSPFPADLRDDITRRRQLAADVTASPDATPLLSFTTKSGHSYRQARWTLDDAGLEVLTPNGWISVPFADLPDDRSSFPAGLQQAITARSQDSDASGAIHVVNFTTRQGKRYDQVRATLAEKGVRILTDEGWLTVPFADLPTNLSAFPLAWQGPLQESQKYRETDSTGAREVTFTTRQGIAYQDVRASLDTDGVRVLTPNGWTTLSFAELPADLSPFPAEWRAAIEQGRRSRAGDGATEVFVSFTTRQGKCFDQVRARLDDDGLHVLGPDGWVHLSYAEVPSDLSPFPEAWRATMAAQEKEPAKTTASARP